jgi:tetratricopeptide (TPR) repeat protein
MVRRRIVIIGLAALLLTGVGGVVGMRHGSDKVAATPAAATPVDRLAASIARAQQRLRDLPSDYDTWAALGAAYLERARVTADPSYYPKAEGALRRSLTVRKDDNAAALIGLGALANARHDFAAARELARRALRIDSYSADAYGVLADAQTQLCDAGAATSAVQRMLDLRPGLAAYARASYDLEQHGRLDEAESLMRRALVAAVDPADVAFCRYQLGELAWQTGRLGAASTEYAAGRAADPSYVPLVAGQARVAAAHGRIRDALAGYAELTARYPAPGYLIEYADLLRAVGQPARADEQLVLAAAALRLFTANGGTDDLGTAQLAIAQDRPGDAVRAAHREWSRRHFADVADVLGWALHQARSDAQALPHARRASALGARNAGYLFHVGMIELSLGQTAEARRDLSAALALNPHFSPRYAPVAEAALSRLGTR